MFSQPEITIPEKLPFLEKLCWQRQSITHLTGLEMLQIYERGWRYQGVLGNLSPAETRFVQELAQIYNSWLAAPMFHQELHQKILIILQQINADFFLECGAYFGDGTLVSLNNHEYRLSKDIDFICATGAGYRWLRQKVSESNYNAIFNTQDNLQFPGEIKADQYGIRFPIIADKVLIKFEIILEGRIQLEPPNYPPWSPIPCLNEIDIFAEKLLANADRWPDSAVESRDLIDLAMQRIKSPIPPTAIAKAEKAYAVIEPLKKAIAHFQVQPNYRDKCFTALRILNLSQVIDGLDLLARDFDLENTVRTFTESQQN
jgi:hypothetical protein